MNLLDIPTLAKMSLRELGNLAITQVWWFGYLTLGFTLSNGKTCRAGTYTLDTSHTFDPSKKITKIVTTVRSDEYEIYQIKFFSGEEKLRSLGCIDDHWWMDDGRVETFEIADD